MHIFRPVFIITTITYAALCSEYEGGSVYYRLDLLIFPVVININSRLLLSYYLFGYNWITLK